MTLGPDLALLSRLVGHAVVHLCLNRHARLDLNALESLFPRRTGLELLCLLSISFPVLPRENIQETGVEALAVNGVPLESGSEIVVVFVELAHHTQDDHVDDELCLFPS